MKHLLTFMFMKVESRAALFMPVSLIFLLLVSKDGGGIFLRNVGLRSKDYMALRADERTLQYEAC
jgi:hypothetical protein